MAVTLFLIRHGETDWNRKHFLQGSCDIPLNEAGRQVARETARGMAAAGLTFHRVYSSPLSRALETARILCPEQTIETDPRLREISFGELEGTAWGEITSLPMPAPGGESSQQLQSRVLACLEDILADPDNGGKTILVSVHGAVIRSVLMHLRGIPHEDFWKGRVSRNCGVTILRWDGETLSLQQEDLSFLP